MDFKTLIGFEALLCPFISLLSLLLLENDGFESIYAMGAQWRPTHTGIYYTAFHMPIKWKYVQDKL